MGSDSDTCVCAYNVFWSASLSRERQSPLWALALIVQVTAAVIPQASWQLTWLLLASIKRKFLQKAVIPSIFRHEACCCAWLYNGLPSVSHSVLGGDIPCAADTCLSTDDGDDHVFLHKEPAWQSHPSLGVCPHPHLTLSRLWSNASMGKEKSLRTHWSNKERARYFYKRTC